MEQSNRYYHGLDIVLGLGIIKTNQAWSAPQGGCKFVTKRSQQSQMKIVGKSLSMTKLCKYRGGAYYLSREVIEGFQGGHDELGVEG